MLTPVAVGAVAGTAMTVGTAMVTVVLPCAALLIVTAVMAARQPTLARGT